MIKGARLHFSQLAFYIMIILSMLSCDAKLPVKFIINNNGYGSYSFEYKTADGTYRTEDGGLITGQEGDVFVIRGEYGYIDTNGQPYSLRYVADANGFQPQADGSTRFNDRRII